MDPRLIKLRKQGVYLGTSSWKYPGWKGLIYRAPYRSEKDFQSRCLEEYGTLYPTVGVDHTYYAFPKSQQLLQYAQTTPEHFRFVFKVPDQITTLQFPNLPRYGKRAGTLNPFFLDPDFCLQELIEPLKQLGAKAGPVVFEFSRFRPQMIASGRMFLQKLGFFFQKLRLVSDHPFAVEIRNHNWLVPEYFSLLQRLNVAHTFNSWTYMPLLAEQQRLAGGTSMPFFLLRLLLYPGKSYADAVKAFSPYTQLKQPLHDVRMHAVSLIEQAITEKKQIYVLINNRLEGCAPQTLKAILDLLETTSQILPED